MEKREIFSSLPPPKCCISFFCLHLPALPGVRSSLHNTWIVQTSCIHCGIQEEHGPWVGSGWNCSVSSAPPVLSHVSHSIIVIAPLYQPFITLPPFCHSLETASPICVLRDSHIGQPQNPFKVNAKKWVTEILFRQASCDVNGATHIEDQRFTGNWILTPVLTHTPHLMQLDL